MKNLINPAKRTALTVTLFLVSCLAALAQTVSGPTCIPHPTVTSAQYTYTLGTNQVFSSWGTKGDLLLGTTSFTGSTYTANVSSTDFGRGQVIFYYTIAGSPACSPTPVILQVNKNFPVAGLAATTIVGPTCVSANSTVTYSVPPIISAQKQINAQIGVDSYTWTTVPASGPGIPSIPAQTSAAGAYSGDASSIQLVIPANPAPFTLRVQTGACNTNVFRTIPVNPTPAPAPITGPTVCRATNDNSQFALSINSVSGTTYTWSKPPTWSFAEANATTGMPGTGGLLTVNVTPGTAGDAGVVSVTASNGGTCGTSITTYRLNRKLDPLVNTLSIVGNPTCLVPGTDYTYSVAPFPNNSLFTWSVPAGFTYNGTPSAALLPVAGQVITSGPTITLKATAAVSAGTVTVYSDNCSGFILSKTATVSGPGTCAYTVTDSNILTTPCGNYKASLSGGTAATCAGAGTLFAFSLTIGGVTTNSPITSANTWKPLLTVPAGTVVTCVVTKPGCLRVVATPYTTTVPTDEFTQCRGVAQPDPSQPTSAPVTGEALVTYPNPTGGLLTVNLPETRKPGSSTKLTLVDNAGRTVLTKTTQENRASLDVRALPEGLYTIRAQTNGKVLTQQVAVQH